MSFLRSPQSSTVVTPQYTGIQVQASSSALPIPIIWGVPLVAPNVVWAGDFVALPQYSSSSGKGGLFGSGGGQLTGYDYRTAVALGLCEGPISAVRWAYDGQTTYYLSDLNFGLLKGPTPQNPWGYLTANHPAKAINYPGTALVVSPSYDLGSSSSIGSLSFEVVAAFSGTSVTHDDADPALIVGDFLTNAQYGVGFPAASIDATTLYGASGDGSYQTYCAAIGIGLSPALTNQEAANSVLSRWLQLTNSTAVWSGGKLKFIPYGDAPATGTLFSGTSVNFAPNATPVADLGDDDFVADSSSDPVVVTRADPYAASNVVHLEVLNRAPTYQSGAPVPTYDQYGNQLTGFPNYYAPTPIEARDQNAIELYGLRVGSTVTAHEICNLAVASVAAQLILQRGLYIRNTYAFRLSWDYCLLEPMDIVTLSDANLGLARTPVRITEIQEGSDGLLSVTAEEYPGSVGTSPGYAIDSATSTPVTRNVAPASVNPPLILEPPSELTAGVEQIRIGLSGGTSGVADPNWGGAAIFVSTDNATYTQVGSVNAPSRQGVLTAALGALPGSPSDTLSVSFAESGAIVVIGATPMLIVVDGEIMSFSTATLTGTNTYSLGGLSRKLYGQRGSAHAVGAQALILDGSVFRYALPTNLIGTPLWLKFASFNIFGAAQQSLAACTAYAYTPVGSGLFGPVSQAIAAGTSLDEGMASAGIGESDDYGLASDPYTRTLDMGLASEAATALAVQSGGTGATSPTGARQNIGAAASGANTDITSLSGLTMALSIAQGGTGAATASGARTNLGTAASGVNADIISLTNLAGLGIGTGVDTGVNKLAVKSSAILFDNIGGGVQVTVDKAGAGDTGTILYQTGYSGRASAGLLGGDRYRILVSATGSSFSQALDIDPATGHVGLAGYAADANNALGVSGTSFLFSAAVDSCRFTFNKLATANDASLTFETGFSARALAGLLGSDGYQLKVSPDGSTFHQVYAVDQTTGNIAFKALLFAASYTVAALPAGLNGALAFATNGRKIGEGAGAGTGVVVAFSNGSWRRLSDDSVVAS